MPGVGNPLIVGGGISLGSPAVVNNFLKLTSASPPSAATSPRLIERTTSIEILGDGTTSTAIGNTVDANGTNHVAIGNNITTGAGLSDCYAIGNNITLNNSNQLALGSIVSGSANYALASSWVGIGTGQTYSILPSNSVLVGAAVNGSGNSCVAIGAAANITGNGGVAIGANAQAGLNSLCIGQLATSGTGGAAHNISIGASATGPAATNGIIQIGNRATAAGTVAAGDILLGHQDNSNSIFSTRLVLGGGPNHVANTTVPAFTIRGRTASGTNITANDTAFQPAIATGNAAGGGITFGATAPGASGATAQTVTVAMRVDPSSNITLAAAAGSYGSGTGVVFIGNATAVPSANPTGGGILYVTGGALVFRGSAGTVTPIAPA